MQSIVENRDQERLTLLVRAGEMFHQSLDVAATLNNVARLAAEAFADICFFDLIDERSDRLFVTASAHRDRQMEEALASVSTILYVEEFGVHPVVQVARTGKPFFLPHIDEQVILAHAASRQHAEYMRRLGYRSKIVVPVTAQNHLFGVLTFVRTNDSPEFDNSDLFFAVELGRRAGLAVANAKQFHREQHVAETLQRSFLPNRFPNRDGIQISAHYRPGSTEADVGGDWYDTFETERGEILITIGDITGKGIQAAQLMVLVRQAIRVAALETDSPQKIAQLCNRLLLAEGGERLASAFIGIIDPRMRTLRYVSAGHPPPLLRLPDRQVRRLEAPSPPLGAFRDSQFTLHATAISDESMLVLYTDGLTEITRNVVEGEAMLERVVRSDAVVHAANAAEFVERAIANHAPRDDIAILVVRFGTPERRWEFEAEDARAAYTMRDEFFRVLAQTCVHDEEAFAASGLIFAELIGNAVRHAPGPISVSMEIRCRDVRLHVIDRGPGFRYEPALPDNLWAEGGRGLFLVNTLAHHVTVEQLAGLGSHITVTLPVKRKTDPMDSESPANGQAA